MKGTKHSIEQPSEDNCSAFTVCANEGNKSQCGRETRETRGEHGEYLCEYEKIVPTDVKIGTKY